MRAMNVFCSGVLCFVWMCVDMYACTMYVRLSSPYLSPFSPAEVRAYHDNPLSPTRRAKSVLVPIDGENASIT